jgi:nitrogen fixation protein NifT
VAKVMLRKGQSGQLLFYVAKKDLEAEVAQVQFDAPDKWGGVLDLKDGSRYFVEPLAAPPKLPQTVEARRLDPGETP